MDFSFLVVLLTPWSLALLGLCIGSFLNVVIHRMPLMLERTWKSDSAEMLGVTVDLQAPISLSAPRSRCPACGHAITWRENIPVLSYLWLRGKCSACKTSISARYPFVEVLTATLFAALAVHFDSQPVTLLWCGFTAVLVALAGIDWDTTLLPDDLTLPLLWGGLVAAALGLTVSLHSALWGAVAGYLSLWSVYWVFKLATGKEGMGYGDFKLLAALGAWLGVSMVLPVVLGASIIGAVVGIAMKLNSSLREGRYVPFGPFLAGSGVAVLLLGPSRVLQWLGWA
jgi:leader peptidase (prepilin peptidase)/N-methyltransferase